MDQVTRFANDLDSSRIKKNWKNEQQQKSNKWHNIEIMTLMKNNTKKNTEIQFTVKRSIAKHTEHRTYRFSFDRFSVELYEVQR